MQSISEQREYVWAMINEEWSQKNTSNSNFDQTINLDHSY
jgi:hypothetical protein